MNKGWKPLPVILKIVFIILLFRTTAAIFSLSAIYNDGQEYFGYTFYGMYALNFHFILSIALPIILLVGMHQRYKKIWLVAIAYFLLISISALASLYRTEEIISRIAEQIERIMPRPAAMDDDMYQQILMMAFMLSVFISVLFNMALMILVIIKRKYFSTYEPESDEGKSGKLPSQ